MRPRELPGVDPVREASCVFGYRDMSVVKSNIESCTKNSSYTTRSCSRLVVMRQDPHRMPLSPQSFVSYNYSPLEIPFHLSIKITK